MGPSEAGADELAEQGTLLQQAGVGSVEEGRDAMVEAFETINAQTDAMLADLEAMGAPAVESGDDIARDLQADVARIEPVLEETGQRVADLPDDPDGFIDGTQDIAVDVVGELGVADRSA